ALRSYLNSLKIECIIDQKKYSEAKKELMQMLPLNEELKKKMVQATQLEELALKQDRYFMARSKTHFLSQNFALDPMSAELDFWMHLLTNEKMVYEDEAILKRILEEIKGLIEHKMITADTLTKSLEKMSERMKQETELLDQQYHVFMEETAKEFSLK